MTAREIALYDELTGGGTRFLRVDELIRRAAIAAPDLLPDEAALEAEARLPLRDKQKLEVAQGRFLSRVL